LILSKGLQYSSMAVAMAVAEKKMVVMEKEVVVVVVM
jgi:hypothetical protein